MAFLEFEAFFTAVKQGEISNVYLFYGPESYYLKGSVKQVVGAAVEEGSEAFNLVHINGEKLDLDRLEAESLQLPVFGRYRCIVVSGFSLGTLDSAAQKRLKALIDDLPETAVLVLAMTPEEVNLKKDAKLKSFAQKVAEKGTVVCFERLSPAFVRRTLAGVAKKRGVSLQNDAADLLIQRCGTLLNPLLVELEKQINYCAGGVITAQSVSELTVESTEESVFALGKAILGRNSDLVFGILKSLFAQKIPPVNIISTLNTQYIDLYRAYHGRKNGIPHERAARDFNYRGKEFLIKNAYGSAARFKEAQLIQALYILLDADTALKSSRAEDEVIIQKSLAKLLLI